MYDKMDVVNQAAIIDTNHSNSGKKFKEQIRIAKEVMHNRQLSSDIKSLVKGLMIESYIEEGSQKIGEHVYGKSITDPCLGMGGFKEAYLRHCRNEFLNHKLYIHFFYKTQATGVYILWLALFCRFII